MGWLATLTRYILSGRVGSRGMRQGAEMMRMKTITILCSATVMLASGCSPSSSAMPTVASKVYVLVPPQEAASFTTVLVSAVKRHGMSADVARATDDNGHVLNVLDAKGDGLRLRSENVLLSGQEDPAKCGVHPEPYSDPGQYFISVSSGSDAAARQAASALLLRVGEDLKTAGYVVQATPVICSAAIQR